jgi:hypothetical protein
MKAQAASSDQTEGFGWQACIDVHYEFNSALRNEYAGD